MHLLEPSDTRDKGVLCVAALRWPLPASHMSPALGHLSFALQLEPAHEGERACHSSTPITSCTCCVVDTRYM